MSCVCKRQYIKYDIKCLNNLIMLSICKVEVDNLDMKYIINNLIKNIDVKICNVPRSWESKAGIRVQMTILLIYYRFIVRVTIGFEFLFMAFLLQFFLAQMSSLSISSTATYPTTFSNHIYLSIDIIITGEYIVVHDNSNTDP